MNTIEITSGPSFVVRPAVSLSGLEFTVESGAFTVSKTVYNLDESQSYTVTPDADDPTHVHGYLVRAKADSLISLLVDSFTAGPSYVFTEDGPYELLWHLLTIKVPAGATELDEADVTVRWTKPKED